MLPSKQLLFLVLAFIFYSCNNSSKYPFAIKDFRGELRPYLTKMVEKGVVMNRDSALQHIATDQELLRLGQSEHPILRAAAFREMLDRKSFNHYDLLMTHLSDTAFVATDAGEFGIWDRTVSDDILQEASWETQEAKNKTVEEVLTRHNYLRSAYVILTSLEPQEKYYSFIKNMATRPRRLSYEGYELGFDDIEYALYGLATFRKKEDLEIIKAKMMENVWKLSEVSFRLLQEYPDTIYFDVLQLYHRRQFYKFSGNRPGGFSGFIADRAAPEDFIQALVIQETDKSAKLLDTMLNRLPLRTCMPDKETIIDEIITAVWKHPCVAYTKLRERIKPKAEQILKSHISIPLDQLTIPVDTTRKIIRWFN
ncbi:hypothetical protein [Foetidibacter luteolus]|uniref:hypothetical protein n=1 Tax=Foetidibacter luteolus TaxID=2608880 RepID=UPI00129BEABE|nr:hypothetical protein [Foetidibacter luteolus]